MDNIEQGNKDISYMEKIKMKLVITTQSTAAAPSLGRKCNTRN